MRPTSALFVALLAGTGCLGATPSSPAGTWEGECHLSPTVPFTLDGMLWIASGEDVLTDATGTWTIFTGTSTWDDEDAPADIAYCGDSGGCTLSGLLYRPESVIVLFYTAAQPAMVGVFEGGTMSGDCFDGGDSGDFVASRPEN